MIGRVYRGGKVGGLLRYLYGPGRHNEHEDPHLVAAWDLVTPAELATLEPRVLAGEGATAVRDFGPMTASMELATALRRMPESVAAKQVWHCPLRVAPGDRALTDAEWAEVARDVMHRTGIAERGDDGGCRWIAVRHDQHSVHLVAVLARQDGRAVRLSHDHLKLRQACREAETRLGLTATAPADRTAATHTTRAEVEKTARTRGPGALPDRQWLREQVQLAALQAGGAPEFLQHLTAAGVLVRERRDPDGTLTGYAVARPDAEGQPQQQLVFFGGGKLAPDLSLPKLQQHWHQQAAAQPLQVLSQQPRWKQTPQHQARALLDLAHRQIRAAVVSGDRQQLEEAGALAQAAGKVLTAAAQVFDGDRKTTVTRAARQYDRASREPAQRQPPPTPHSRALQDVGRVLVSSGRLSRSDGLVLLGQVLLLVDAVRQLRVAQGRQAQAEAAARAAATVRTAVSQQQHLIARVSAMGTTRRVAAGTSVRRPAGLPPTGSARRR